MVLRKQLLTSAFIGIALLFTAGVFGFAQPSYAATPKATEAISTGGAEAATSEVHAEASEEDAGLVGLFGLNWKVFVAQLVNFGIILFVLWKWVWGPVTKGLADRTQKIEDSLQEAERINKDRADFESWKQGEMATVRQEAAAIITEARQSAEQLRAQTLDQTKAEQTRIVEQTQAKLTQEKDKLISAAKGEIAGLVIAATESVLQEKLSAKKDQELIDKALRQLR